MSVKTVKELVVGRFYKACESPQGCGIFYITKTRAHNHRLVYSYPIEGFQKMFTNSKFLEMSFEDVLLEMWGGHEKKNVFGMRLNEKVFVPVIAHIKYKQYQRQHATDSEQDNGCYDLESIIDSRTQEYAGA